MEKRNVYCDNAATTAVTRAVLEAMMPYLTECFGNASSGYRLGRQAAKAVLDARRSIAAELGAESDEIFFTSCGSESDNWAVRGAAELGALAGKRHIVTTAVEHHAVLNCCKHLERLGFEVTYLMPDRFGKVSAESVEGALRDDTALVSVMTANNEVGTLMPVAEIGRICRERGVLFHTDAVQAAGHIPVNVREVGADMLSLSGHKLHAPKGVGALFIRRGVKLPSFIDGGSQEYGRRAGTENVAGIVGLAKALSDAADSLAERTERLTRMRGRLEQALLGIEGARLNGHPDDRLPATVNVSFGGLEGESLLVMLDMYGISASSGSACTTGQDAPSHVLTAMGLTEDAAKSSIRFSLGDDCTDEDIGYLVQAVPEAVARLRSMR